MSAVRALAALCSVVAAIAVCPPALLAQGSATVRGDVVLKNGTTPVAGVVVVAVNAAGTESARELSGTGGRFVLTLPAPARYSLRALRIGYRPTVVPAFDLAAGEARMLTVVLADEGVRLDSIRVQGVTTCRIDEAGGRLVANLWDQAQTALAASTLHADGRPFDVTLERYVQFTPHAARVIAAETVTVVHELTSAGFESAPADSLAARGYVVGRGSALTYHAPDATVLLSRSFAETHCFRVAAGPPAHPDWVGVAFSPAPERAKVTDVEGTLWLDRRSAELREMEFRYVNLPVASGPDGDAGGSINWVRLATGEWIVRRWRISSPVTERRSVFALGPRYAPVGERVAGGVTHAVRRDGAELFVDSGASLTLVLRARDSINAAAGAVVRLDGSPNGGTADSLGVVHLDGLAAGRFRAIITTPFGRMVGALPLERDVEVAFDSVQRVDVALPSADQLATKLCGSHEVLLYGSVYHAAGLGVAGARVDVEWNELSRTAPPPPTMPSRSGRRGGGNMRVPNESPPQQTPSGYGITDEAGRWRACAQAGVWAAVSVRVGGSLVQASTRFIPSGSATTRMDLAVP